MPDNLKLSRPAWLMPAADNGLPSHLQGIKKEAEVSAPALPTDLLLTGTSRGKSASMLVGERVTLVDIGDDSLPPELLTISMSMQGEAWSEIIAPLAQSSYNAGVFGFNTIRRPGLMSMPVFCLITYGAFNSELTAMVDCNGSLSVVASRIKVEAIWPRFNPILVPFGVTDPAGTMQVSAFVGRGGVESKARLSAIFFLIDPAHIAQSFFLPIPPRCTRFLMGRLNGAYVAGSFPMATQWDVVVTDPNAAMVYNRKVFAKNEMTDWIDVPAAPCQIRFAPDTGLVAATAVAFAVSVIYEMEF